MEQQIGIRVLDDEGYIIGILWQQYGETWVREALTQGTLAAILSGWDGEWESEEPEKSTLDTAATYEIVRRSDIPEHYRQALRDIADGIGLDGVIEILAAWCEDVGGLAFVKHIVNLAEEPTAMIGEDYKQTMIYALRQDRSALEHKVHDREAEIRELQESYYS